MLILFRVSLVTQVVKESSYNAGDLDWIPGLGRSSGEHSSVPAGRISWIEEPGRLQSMGLHRVRYS